MKWFHTLEDLLLRCAHDLHPCADVVFPAIDLRGDHRVVDNSIIFDRCVRIAFALLFSFLTEVLGFVNRLSDLGVSTICIHLVRVVRVCVPALLLAWLSLVMTV